MVIEQVMQMIRDQLGLKPDPVDYAQRAIDDLIAWQRSYSTVLPLLED